MVIQALFVNKANDLHSQFTQYFTCIWICQTGIFDLSHYMSIVFSPHFRWCRVNLYNIRQSGALRISSDGQFQDFRIVLKLCEIRWNIHHFFALTKKVWRNSTLPFFIFFRTLRSPWNNYILFMRRPDEDLLEDRCQNHHRTNVNRCYDGGHDSQLHSCNKFDLTVIFLFSRWWPRYLTCGAVSYTHLTLPTN